MDDDWKLKSKAVVRIKREPNMFVSSYCIVYISSFYGFRVLGSSDSFMFVEGLMNCNFLELVFCLLAGLKCESAKMTTSKMRK